MATMKRTPAVIRAMSKHEDAYIFFTTMRDKLETKYDSKSEHWQDTESGFDMSSQIDSLSKIIDSFESTADLVNELFECED